MVPGVMARDVWRHFPFSSNPSSIITLITIHIISTTITAETRDQP
jgi:hypothetical protein